MLKRWMMVIALVFVLGMVGLGSPTQALQGQGGALEQMLGQVPDNAVSRTLIWYGSAGDLERILGVQFNNLQDFQKLPPQQQAAYSLDLGNQVYTSSFSGLDNWANWQKTFAIDPFAIDRELTVGTKPNWYAILSGKFAADTITQALQQLGYKTAQVGQATVYSLGGDNTVDQNSVAAKLSGGQYNRLVVTDSVIVAAPSTAMIQAATSGKALVSDAAYAALVRVLEGANTVPNTQLLSAALFNGQFLTDRLLNNVPAPGQPLPRYQTAGLGFRRDANNRYWVIALVYANANDANQAQAELTQRLAGYASLTWQPGRKLFEGWKLTPKVTPAANGGLQVVTVSMQLPAQTDMSWIELVLDRDLGFLK